MGAIQVLNATIATLKKPGALDHLSFAGMPNLQPKDPGGKGAIATARTTPIAPPPRVPAPPDDTGKTWGSPESKRDLNFGHLPGADGNLFQYHESGRLLWADNDKTLTADQWANMPGFQQAKLRAMVQANNPGQLAGFDKAMSKGNAARAQTQPKGIDNSQVSPFTSELAQFNLQAQEPSAVADRVRQALDAS